MIHFIFSEKDKRYLFLKFDNPEDEKWLKSNTNPKKQPNLTNLLNLIDPVCNLKSFTGIPFTQDFLFSYVNTSGNRIYYCSIGLWQIIWKFFELNNVEYDGLEPKWLKRDIQHTFEEFKEIVDNWGLSRTPRPYQYKAAYKILCWNKSVSELATRAGKTLIAYMVFRYCSEYLHTKRMLMIVPAIQLVLQGYNDFKEYKEFFNTECIWGGGELVESANLTIGTFQSLIKFLEKTVVDQKTKQKKPNPKYNPHFFNDYDIVFVDETHRAAADQIKTIISQPFMNDVKIAFGMTGTLPHEQTIERYCVHSLLGAKIQEISTAELKEAGYISDIEIFQYRLNYTDIEKQIKLYIKCAEYCISNYVEVPNPKHPERNQRLELPKEQQDFLIRNVKEIPYGVQEAKLNIYANNSKSEILKDIEWMEMLKAMVADSTGANGLLIERMIVHFMHERIDFLCDEILPKCDKNTLILCHHTEYINHLVNIVEEKFSDTKIITKITGSISLKKREKIVQLLKENNNVILIASYGCMSTGITLANLCYGVLFESFKSDVVNMQSIGRGLGLSEIKDKYRLFDIVDCFNNKITNKIYLQGCARIKIYESDFNKHKYSIIQTKIGEVTTYNKQFNEAYQLYLNNLNNEKPIKKKKEKEQQLSDVEMLMNNLF